MNNKIHFKMIHSTNIKNKITLQSCLHFNSQLPTEGCVDGCCYMPKAPPTRRQTHNLQHPHYSLPWHRSPLTPCWHRVSSWDLPQNWIIISCKFMIFHKVCLYALGNHILFYTYRKLIYNSWEMSWSGHEWIYYFRWIDDPFVFKKYIFIK